MIDPNENGFEATANTGTPSPEATPEAQPQTPAPPQFSQKEYFDAFNQFGVTDKEKLNLLTAQGFDVDSSYALIMDDYNAQREELLANQERLERLQEESKKKDSSSVSGEEGFESGGTDFEEQAFGEAVATADPRVIMNRDADEALVQSYDFARQAQELRDLASQEEDVVKKQQILTESRKLSAQSHLQNKKATEAMNQVFELNGSEMRLNPESDVDNGFMINTMVKRGIEEDALIRKDMGYLGIEDRQDLEEFKMLGGVGDVLGRDLEQLREEEWDGSYGLERLYDNFYTTFGSGTYSAAAGLSDMVGGVFGVDMDDNEIAKYYRAKNERINGRNQRSREKGMEELGIRQDLRGLGTLDTFTAALGDLDALQKFVAVDLPDAFGMVAGEAAIFMATRGLGRSGMLADRLAKTGRVFGKGGQALTIGQSMLSAGAASLAPTLLSYIPRSYETFRERHPDAPQSQAAFFGTMGGIAEGMMSALMLGVGKGSQAAVARSFNKAGTKAAIQKEVRKALGKKGGSPFLADMSAEGLEEGFVAYTEELLNAASDVLNGKDAKDVNFHTVLDAAFIGMIGGAGPASLSAASSGFSHSSNLKNAQNRAEVARRLRKEYESEKDPKKKAYKRKAYAAALKNMQNVKQKDAELYEALDDAQVDELMGVHQEIAQISSDLQKGEYINGAKITKEEKDAMKGRLESLFTRKADIEIEAQAKAFKESIPGEIKVPDAKGSEAPAQERTVEKVEKDSHENIDEAPEAAPAEQQEEQGQLSMFDENTMDDMVQKKEDAPSTEKTDATAEAEVTGQAQEGAQQATAEAQTEEQTATAEDVAEDAFDLDLAAGESFDLKDTKVVGEGAGQVPLQVAATVNRMTKAFGAAIKAAGTKLKAHRTMESFMNLNEEVRKKKGYLESTDNDGNIQGYFDPTTNTVHLNPLSDSMDAMEEIGHLVLAPTIGKNGVAREALYKEMEEIAKGKSLGARNVQKILEVTKKDYGDQSLAKQQEEAIISVLVNYANDSSVFKGVESKLVKAINKILKSVGFKKNIISGKEGLFELADKFKKASEGVETEVDAEAAPASQTADLVAEEAPAAEEAPVEEAAPAPKVKTKKPLVMQQRTTNNFVSQLLKAYDKLTANASTDARAALADPGEGKATIRGYMMRGERINAEYENDILAEKLANGEVTEGIFYYRPEVQQKSDGSLFPHVKPGGFLPRNWETSNFGPESSEENTGGYQVEVKSDGKGDFTYRIFYGNDTKERLGSVTGREGGLKGSTLEQLKKESDKRTKTAQSAVPKQKASGLKLTSTQKQKRQSANSAQVAVKVAEFTSKTIKNPSRASEGKAKLQAHAKEVAGSIAQTVGDNRPFRKKFVEAMSRAGVELPSADARAEAVMEFINESSFWGWGDGKGLGNRPHSGDALRKELSSQISEKMDSDPAAQKKAPQQEKSIEEQADELLAGTEGISTPEGDALNQADQLDSGRMSVRRKQEFNYLKDAEIFYENHPYMGPDDAPTVGGRFNSFSVNRSIKVNDYFHFRNWYNKTTGNQTVTRITNMYYIKDGKKYKIKPPRPKVDRSGKPVYMQIPATPRAKRKALDKQEAASEMDLKLQARDIRDAANKVLKSIPWGRMTNVSMFAPPQPSILEMTPAQIYEAAVIQKKNVDAAAELGLTEEQVRERVNAPGRGNTLLNSVEDGDLLQATGMSPFEESGDGDTVGMFAVRSELELEKAGVPIREMAASVRSFFGKTDEGSLEEISKLVGMAIMGYDQTGKRRKGITSGIVALLDLPDNVLSTHVNVQTARAKLNQITNRAVAHYLDTKEKTGELGVGFSLLNPEATLGNPDVFIEYMNGLEALIKKGELAPTDFLSDKTGVGITATSIPSLRYALSQEANLGNKVASDVLNDIILSRHAKGTYKIQDNALTKEHVLGMIDALKKHHKNLPDSFSSRKKLFSSKLTTVWLDSLGDTNGSMQFSERVANYYNDSALNGVEPATLTAYKAFPYELEVIEEPTKNEDGKLVGGTYKLKGARVESDPSLGFGGKIVLDSPSKMKHMKKLYRLEDIDPDYKYKSTTKEKAEKADMTPRGAALLANQRSLYEFNQEAQDVDISDTSAKGPFSVRNPRGFRTVKTDQGSWQMRELNGFQRWRNKWLRRLQDKYIDVFQLQEDVEAARGRRGADQDFRMAEELMYGKAAEDLNKLDQKVDSITEAMKEKGFSVQEVSDYIYALHAKERNALIRERSEGEEKEGSGMSDQRADEIIASFQNKKEDVAEIVAMIREIQQDTRDTMVKFGLESQETIDAFEAQFENYVPLSGIAIDEESSVTSAYPTGGAGMSIFGPSTKRAEGRKSEATNVLAQIIAQNSSIHIKARTNEALQSLHNLVADNPNQDVWTILDGKDVNSMDPHIVSVRVNGEQKFIRFKDASYAETLRNMNLPQTGIFVKMLRAPSNWLRRSFTTLNPEFMISNFSRDIQAAMFNAAAEADIEGGLLEGKGIISEMITLTPKTLKMLMRSESPQSMKRLFAENPELERYYQDFKDDGGKTGWSYAKPLDQIAKDLESKAGNKNGLQSLLGKAENFADVVEGYNDAFENSIRLSAYIAARKKGVTREKAAQMAKNITVNFNKSGEYGQVLNSVYLFFNASVQGTARLGKSLLTMKPPTYPDGTKREFKDRFNNAQKMAAALTIFSGMAAMLALGMSDEDEDGELYYNKIPDYIKERNLIFMRPNGKDYFKIPLPYGFSMFANLGTVAVEVGGGHKEIDTAMMQMVSSFMNSFSPISFGQSKDLFTKAGKSAVPTVFKPLVDVMTNETYFGGPVYTENLPYGLQRPESSMSFRSPESVKSFFRWMNEATGGSVNVKGDLDFNPDKAYYMFEYFIGGAGKFVTRTGKVARGLAAKVEDNDIQIEANDLPFMRILYGQPSKYMDMEDYRSRRQEVMQLYKELKNNPRTDKPARYKGIGALNKALKGYDKMLKSLRDAKRRALEIEDYTERMKRIQDLRDKERKIVMQFNKFYEQIR